MSRLSKVNVVFLSANLVAAILLALGLWKYGAAGKAAVARILTGRAEPTPVAASSQAEAPKDDGLARSHGESTSRDSTGSESPPAGNVDGGTTSGEQPAAVPRPPPVASGYVYQRPAALRDSSREVAPTPATSTPAVVPAGARPSPPATVVHPATGVPGVPVRPAPTTVTAGPSPATHEPRPNPTPAPEPSPPTDPTSDRTPPAVDSIGFNPPEIEDGATTMLMVSVHDDLSGVKKVGGNLRSPSAAAIISFEAQGEAGGNAFVAKIMIPKQAETGNWYVANLFVPDRADNTLVLTYTAATAPPGALLRVLSSQPDNTPPEVRSAAPEKPSVRDGESNVIRVDVQDDNSGVATVSGIFQSPAKTAFIPFACRLNPDTGMWEGQFTVPGNASCGEWSLLQIRAADKAGNIATVPGTAPQLARSGFFVGTEGGCDSTAPTLESFVLSPTVVSNEAASDIVITAQVHDEGTGTVSVIGWATGPVAANGQSPQISFSCTHRPTDPQDVWTGKFVVPQYAAKGPWRVGRVRVQDKALNNRDYGPEDPVLYGATFDVQ